MQAQVAEEQEQQLAQLRTDLAERLLLSRQRLEEEHATLVEAHAQVCNPCPCWLILIISIFMMMSVLMVRS